MRFKEGAYYSPYRFRIVKQVIPDSQATVSAFDYKDRPSFPDLFQLSDHMTDLAFVFHVHIEPGKICIIVCLFLIGGLQNKIPV